ncbi:MAG: universal stress protein [Chitinophagaceae bacterium]|jgi:nucleotide-binding universal stress UspA family protein|nr:MAG: universal stress protein [Chitinophagaceae bacterium]
MKRILIALDYDSSAQIVAEKGFTLAKSMNAEVTLLHVLREVTYYSSIEYSPIIGYDASDNAATLWENISLDDLKKAAHNFLLRSKQHLGDDSLATMLKEGDVSDAIFEAVHELKSDIIVMGMYSRKGLDKLLMGSVAEKVLHHSHIPVFIIPLKEHTP